MPRTPLIVALAASLVLCFPTTSTSGETAMTTPSTSPPGYRAHDRELPRATLTLSELSEIEATLLFGESDREALRRSRALLEPKLDAILDVWYGFVGSQPHLLDAFVDRTKGAPDARYLERVRLRFRQWILDTTEARHDEQWLAWQAEIGRRHHRVGKNRTDSAQGAETIPVRHLIALSYPIAATLRPFLSAPGVPADEVEVMLEAWRRVVLLQAILWAEPAVKPGDF